MIIGFDGVDKSGKTTLIRCMESLYDKSISLSIFNSEEGENLKNDILWLIKVSDEFKEENKTYYENIRKKVKNSLIEEYRTLFEIARYLKKNGYKVFIDRTPISTYLYQYKTMGYEDYKEVSDALFVETDKYANLFDYFIIIPNRISDLDYTDPNNAFIRDLTSNTTKDTILSISPYITSDKVIFHTTKTGFKWLYKYIPPYRSLINMYNASQIFNQIEEPWL